MGETKILWSLWETQFSRIRRWSQVFLLKGGCVSASCAPRVFRREGWKSQLKRKKAKQKKRRSDKKEREREWAEKRIKAQSVALPNYIGNGCKSHSGKLFHPSRLVRARTKEGVQTAIAHEPKKPFSTSLLSYILFQLAEQQETFLFHLFGRSRDGNLRS